MNNKTIGTRLNEIRNNLGFSQGKFANELNITQQTYSLIEKDKRSPNINILKSLAEKFNVNLNWLILGYGPMFREFMENIELYREKNAKLKELIDKMSEVVRGY